MKKSASDNQWSPGFSFLEFFDSARANYYVLCLCRRDFEFEMTLEICIFNSKFSTRSNFKIKAFRAKLRAGGRFKLECMKSRLIAHSHGYDLLETKLAKVWILSPGAAHV